MNTIPFPLWRPRQCTHLCGSIPTRDPPLSSTPPWNLQLVHALHEVQLALLLLHRLLLLGLDLLGPVLRAVRCTMQNTVKLFSISGWKLE